MNAQSKRLSLIKSGAEVGAHAYNAHIYIHPLSSTHSTHAQTKQINKQPTDAALYIHTSIAGSLYTERCTYIHTYICTYTCTQNIPKRRQGPQELDLAMLEYLDEDVRREARIALAAEGAWGVYM